jgi:hypothetical protein
MTDVRDDVTRDEIIVREHGICARCGHTGCDAHHRQPKARGGKDTWVNLILLCRACHDWAHVDNPVQAEIDGLLLHSWDDPATRTAPYHLLRARVLLRDDSSVQWVEALR